MGNQLKLIFFQNLCNNDINGCFNYPQQWSIPENIQHTLWMALEILYKFLLPSKFSETNDSGGGGGGTKFFK